MTSMELRRCLIFCISALMLVTDAIADELPVAPITPTGHMAIDYAASMKYHEPGMSESGRPYGIFLDWDIAPARRWTIVGNFTALVGHLNYDGATQSGIPLKNKTSDDVFMGELAVGLHLGAAKNKTLYAGIGKRYWKDYMPNALTVTGVTAFGYHRDITYLYAPVGMRVEGALGPGWRLQVDAKYMSLIHGRVQSHLEDADPRFSTLQNSQHHGHGYAVGVRFAHPMEKNPTFTGYFIEPYYQAWAVPRTDNATIFYAGVPVGDGYEPDNTTRILGVRFGLAF